MCSWVGFSDVCGIKRIILEVSPRLFPCVLFFVFEKFFCCSCFFSVAMEVAPRFIALDRQDLPFVAAATALDDATILSLFWHEANSHHPVDLPDITGLRWREGILRCLENVLPQARISCGEIQPTAVSGQHRVHSKARSIPGAHRVHSRARSVPGAHRVHSRARSVPGAHRVHSRARSVPGAHRVHSRARSVPGAHRVHSRARSVPGAHRVHSRARSVPGAHRVHSRARSVPGAHRVHSRARSVPGAHRVHSRARSVPGAHRVHSTARSVPGAHRVHPWARSVPGAHRVHSSAAPRQRPPVPAPWLLPPVPEHP